MILASGIGAVGRYLERYTTLSELTVDLLNFGLSFTLVSLLFAAIYKLLPNKRLYWRDVVVGACGTALLFQGGRALISFYLTNFISADMYGAAAGLIILMLWIYFHRHDLPAGRRVHQGLDPALMPARPMAIAAPLGPGAVPAPPQTLSPAFAAARYQRSASCGFCSTPRPRS